MQDVQAALRVIRACETRVPALALVLGSGLGDLAHAAEEAQAIPAQDLPGYPASTVAGHQGRLVFGRMEGQEVVFLQGRVHRYEGHPIRAVTFPIRLLHALGIRRLLVTNAAGGINRSFVPGTLMFITDHINFSFANPLSGPNEDGGPRFPDMSAPYDPAWRDQAEQVARTLGIAIRRGVYLGVQGPSYETKAEVRAFERLGADAVGMSTVPEVLQAVGLGMQVLGLSTITNPAAGLSLAPLVHEDVLEVGRQVRQSLERLLRGIIRAL
jgi:purine-nucleoside phosphorylase